MRAFSTSQVAALETRDVAVLNTAAIASLTTTQLGALTTLQMGALSTDSVVALGTSGIGALSTAAVAALSTSAVSALTTSQIQIGLTTKQLSSLTTAQIPALTTAAIVALTTHQISALTGIQVMALTSTQTAVITTDQVTHLTLGSPIVLDLTGDGITTQGSEGGVQFDLYDVGRPVTTGWIAGGDGLLVMDRNHDGKINGGGELFGTETPLSNGGKPTNGYIALAEMDSNADGIISGADTAFADLMVWVDGNLDGTSQAQELHSLSTLGIQELSLAARVNDTVDHGNIIGLISSYTMVDGTTRQMADVWFSTAPVVDSTIPSEANSSVPVNGDVDSAPLVPAITPTLAESLSAYMFERPAVPLERPPVELAKSMVAAPSSLAVSGLEGALGRYYANTKEETISHVAPALQNRLSLDSGHLHRKDAGIIIASIER
jgi:hypothetical protein